MMSAERLYNLMPTIYRQRDLEQGQVLHALLQIMQTEYDGVEADITQFYDNLFIETCQEWVLPYIGDLLGVNFEIAAVKSIKQRAYIANILRNRAKKGQPAVLEQMIHDVTDWYAHVVEFFQYLSMTQSIRHVHPNTGTTVLIRNIAGSALVNTALDNNAHRPEILDSAVRPLKYAIKQVGLFLWRLFSYRLAQTMALPVKVDNEGNLIPLGKNDPPLGYYTFSPLALNMPLYNFPQGLSSGGTILSAAVNLPDALQTPWLAQYLTSYYGAEKAFSIAKINDITQPAVPVPVTDIVIMDLSSQNSVWPQPMPGKVAVDPRLGRISVPMNEIPVGGLKISYSYAFGADLGGGPYTRSIEPTPIFIPASFVQVAVHATSTHPNPDPALIQALARLSPLPEQAIVIQDAGNFTAPDFSTLAIPAAIQTLFIFAKIGEQPVLTLHDQQLPLAPVTNSVRLIIKGLWASGTLMLALSLADALTYLENLTVADNTSVTAIIEIGDSNIYSLPDTFNFNFPPGLIALTIQASNGCRPVIGPQHTLFTITSNNSPALLQLNGLLIAGAFNFDGNLTVQITHTTLVPDTAQPSVSVVKTEVVNGLSIMLDHCITGALQLPASMNKLTVNDSIIDGANKQALTGINNQAGPVSEFARATVIGSIIVHQLISASNTIFTGAVIADDTETGCMRYCSLQLENSITPPRYHCQPDLGLRQRATELGYSDVSQLPDKERQAVEQQLVPKFTSINYGNPAYAQLAKTNDARITMGGEEQTEMGVFQSLYQSQREANIKQLVQEYVLAGLGAVIINVD